jgi:hypothetical protein
MPPTEPSCDLQRYGVTGPLRAHSKAARCRKRVGKDAGLIEPKARNSGAASGQARITPPSSSRRKKSLQSLSRNPDRERKLSTKHAVDGTRFSHISAQNDTYVCRIC